MNIVLKPEQTLIQRIGPDGPFLNLIVNFKMLILKELKMYFIKRYIRLSKNINQHIKYIFQKNIN